MSEGDARAIHAAGIYSVEELARFTRLQLREFLDACRHHRDQLWRIDGVGEVFEGRLNRAGLFSFVDVAASSPERLREIIDLHAWEAIDPTAWIVQARALGAEQRES